MEISATYKINKPIVLVGMMGVGKSTYGKKIANTLKIPFVDIDVLIENEIGHSVNWIFENVGEEKFRKIEEKKIRDILNSGEVVLVALGGGAFLNDNTRKLVKEKAISVWLKSSPEVIYNRVSVRKDRPLLEGTKDKLGKIIDIMNSREKFYKEADVEAFTDIGNQKEIALKVIENIGKFLSKNK
jgi:shikimate kinase